MEKLKALLIYHEGLRLTPYHCSAGKLTIGVGHNLEANPIAGISAGSVITKARAMEILDADIQDVVENLDRFLPWSKSLDEVRRAVLIDMAFNMGIGGLMGFRGFLADLQEGGFSGDSVEMFRSRWAYQVGDGPGKRRDRVDRLAGMIETGLWPPEIIV
jgi:lysozyme